jgi:MFS transporter, CP family, cyanate transporter
VLAVAGAFAWRRHEGPSVAAGPRGTNPFVLRGSGAAWALTIYFGLTSTVSFVVMGWLPAILQSAGLSETAAGGCLALAMAAGLPMMWLVPLWAHRWHRRSLLAVALAVPNMLGIGGLLAAPASMCWISSAGLGVGMGGIALGLTGISLRAGNDPAATTILSAMVQGSGYLIAGTGALACGLLHSAAQTWRGPLVLILIVLCGQALTGLFAVRSGAIEIPRARSPGSGSGTGVFRRMLRARPISSKGAADVRRPR